MASNPFGTVFVEFDMDSSRYMRGQRTLLAEAQNASKTLEKNFHNLGIKSDATFDMMRSRASLAYQAIVNDARSSFGDRLRAQQAYSIAAQRIDMEQFNQEKNLNEQRKQMSRDSQAGWVSMMKGMLAYRVILSGITGVQEAFAGTFRYLAAIETAQLGIGAAFMTSGQYIDATTGKALKGAEALKAAQVESKKVIEELKAANLQTIATLDELIVAYQQTLPVAMAKGFNKAQVKEFTLAMIQAAGAIGLQMNQLGEETRSLLTGAINPRTSRIATVLGLRNEDIAQFKNDAEGLFKFLMEKLSAYKIAGVEAQTTWAGLWSNMKDIMFQFLGEGMTPLFEAIKKGLTDITNSMIVVDETTKTIKWNPEFLETMNTIKSAVTTFVADMRRIVMLIDLAGIGMAMFGKAVTLGMSKTMNDMVDNLTKRLKENEKALMDMAMAAEGYKPATKETPGAISQEGFWYYDKALWYVKEINKETKYQANAVSKVSEETKRLADQWKEQERTLNAQIAGEGLDKYEKKVIDIRREAEKLTEQFKAVPGASAKIAEWRGSQERGVILEQEEEIAKAVEKIREDVMKKEIAAQVFMRQEDKRLRAEQEKGMKEYEKLVTEANDWSISEHQRAINKIISGEEATVAKIYELWEAGTINLVQLQEGLAAVRGATDIAKEAQRIKMLAEELSIYENLAGFEETYYRKSIELLDEKIDRLQKEYNLTKDITDALKEQGRNAIADAATDKRMATLTKQTSGYADLLESIGGLYKENSIAAQRAHQAALAFQIVQQAMLLKEAVSAAVVAVATQGKGDPYSAFARVAAMSAVMVGLLSQMGASFSGSSGGGVSAPTPVPSTILSGEGSGSDSIKNSLDILQDTYDLEYRELTGIHNSVKELNTNITGLVKTIYRAGGMPSGASGMTVGPMKVGDLQSGGEIPAAWDPGTSLGFKLYGTTLPELNQDIGDAVSVAFRNMSDTIVGLAEMFGTDTNAALEYEFKEMFLDLRFLDAEKTGEAIADFLSAASDTAARELFGDLLRGYQQLNEGLFETAIRLANDMTVVMKTLDKTNQSFVDTIPNMIAFSENIVKLAGDLEHLRDISTIYYDKFFTDAEHTARTYEMLTGYFVDMNLAFPATRDGFRSMVEGLDLTTDAGQKQYVTMLELAGAADDYYSAMGDVLDQQENLTKALRDQSEMIQDWISDLSRSALAPVTSQEAWSAEYERQKAMASASGATTQDVSGFLNYAKEYLQFMRTFGGDYQAIFDAVVGDVAQLGEIKDAQIAAIQAADEAARINADRIVAAITTGRDIGGPAPPIRAYASGGLTSGPSLAGESGREWIVPTYEPQRSQFLKSVPPEFWENLRGGGAASGGGDATIRLVNVLDSKVLSDSVAAQIPRNAKLSEAIRRVN